MFSWLLAIAILTVINLYAEIAPLMFIAAGGSIILITYCYQINDVFGACVAAFLFTSIMITQFFKVLKLKK